MNDDPCTDQSKYSEEGNGVSAERSIRIESTTKCYKGYKQYLQGGYHKTEKFLKASKSEHWLAVGTWALVILTWILVLDGRDTANRQVREMKESNKTAATALKAVNRAWIGPSFMALNRRLEQPGPVEVRVLAEKTGHQPATDVVYRFNEFLVPYIPEGPGSAVIKQPNLTCDSLHPSSAGGMVIYPGKTNVHIESNFEDTPGNRAIAIRARNKINTLVVEGCLAYRTVGESHASKFRFFLRDVAGPSCLPLPNGDIRCSWSFNAIGMGNDAN